VLTVPATRYTHGVALAPDPGRTKVVKFCAITYSLILLDHWLIRKTTQWERDAKYTVTELASFDLHPIMCVCNTWNFGRR
jgi:hypothetical protein